MPELWNVHDSTMAEERIGSDALQRVRTVPQIARTSEAVELENGHYQEQESRQECYATEEEGTAQFPKPLTAGYLRRK